MSLHSTYHQTLLHHSCVSHEQNTIPWDEVSSHDDVISIITSRIQQRYGSQRFYGTIRDQLVASCQSSNYTVTTTYHDTYKFIIARCRVIHRSNICQRIIVLWPTTFKSEL